MSDTTERLPRRHAPPLWYVMIISFISSALISLAAVVASNRLWCDTLNTLHEGYTAPSTTPPSPRGLKLAADLDRLRHRFYC